VAGAPACGGGQAEPATPASDSPENLLGDEPEGSVPASSADVQKGIDAIGAEDFAGAKEILSAAVKGAPDDPQAVFYLGVAEAALGETEPAIEHLEKALELDPKLSDAALNLSALLLDQERYEESAAAADRGLKSAPDDTGLLQNKGMALLMAGSAKEALPLLTKASQRKPEDQELKFMLAQAALSSGDEGTAKAQLDGLADSSDRAMLASVADLFGRLQAWDGCVKALDNAIAQEEAGELLVKRGLCRHGKKDEDGARKDFERAIELEPGSPKAHFYLGHNLRARGDNKGAKAAFKKASELDADGPIGGAAKKALGGL
jgi:Tfp pilus assembly protein PilF